MNHLEYLERWPERSFHHHWPKLVGFIHFANFQQLIRSDNFLEPLEWEIKVMHKLEMSEHLLNNYFLFDDISLKRSFTGRRVESLS